MRKHFPRFVSLGEGLYVAPSMHLTAQHISLMSLLWRLFGYVWPDAARTPQAWR